MTPVTDPTLLAKLNMPVAVTDPTILEKLNSSSGYAENVASDWNTAKNKIGEIWANKNLNPTSAGVQMLGTAAGGAFAPAAEAAKSGYNALPNEITHPINETAKSVIQGVEGAYKSGVSKLENTDVGKVAGDYLMNSPHIQSGMQEISDDAKALANILTLSKVKPALGTASEAAGDILYKSGKTAQETANQSHIQELVRPKETPTVKANNALRTKQINGKNVYQPTPGELEMAKTVSDIPGVGNNLSAQGNLGLVIDANKQEASALKTKLQKNNAQIDLGDIQSGINQSVDVLKNHPYVTGDGVPAAQNVINIMNKAILENASQDGKITAANLLQARKDFDEMLPPRIFTATTDTPVIVAAKEMRSMVNKIIASADPSADVLASLKKQTTLYDAADNIAHKAAGEAKTPLGRAAQKLSPNSMKDAIGGAGVGAAALAAAHYLPISPTVIGTALGAAGLYKGLTAPTLRIMAGKAMGGGQ